MTDLIAVFLFVGVVAYAVLGGADFGAGFWDLTAGGAARGRAPRHLIDVSLSPVWEANHTWLIYCLVMLWTGFPRAFAAITTTLYIPLGLAALGIVLRGAGFAFRHASLRTPEQRLYGAAFALSSLLAPYCFGSIVGGIASGRVPTAGNGDPATSWLNPTSALGGVLAVLVCAYLAAVYLCVAAARQGDAALSGWFRDRALAAAVVTGLVSIGGIFILRSDAHRLFVELSHRALPLVILAAVGGVGSIVLLLRRAGIPIGLRETAGAAVALVVLGWGVAQYPYLLGTHLTLDAGAAPRSTQWVLVGVAIAAGAVILPSLVVLFRLAGRGRLAPATEQPPS